MYSPSEMYPSSRAVLLVSVLIGLFSLPLLGYGGYLVVCWFRIHTSAVYYADYSYATSGLAFVGLGLVGLSMTFQAARLWQYRMYSSFLFVLSLFVLPVFFGLVMMLAIPALLPRAASTKADSDYLSDVKSFFRVWYEKNHRFPADESEFREAMSKGPAEWQYRVAPAPMSRYRQRGNPLPYEIVIVTNASGPRVAEVSPRPAVIYYCVSKDLQEFWVTMTALQADFDSSASLKRIVGLPEEKIWEVHAAGRDYPISKP
jgi:hypothetical protein